MRAAIYSRVSTDKQECDNQLLALRQFCLAAGHEITVEYIDAGVSGSGKVRRPAFEQMMTAARQRKFDMVLFWSLDRLSREGARETLNHLQRLTDYGCQWKSYTESYLDSLGPFADVVVALLGTLAKQERIKISERTLAGLQRTKARGTQLGRRADTQAYQAVLTAKQGNPDVSTRALAKLAGVSCETVRRALAQPA